MPAPRDRPDRRRSVVYLETAPQGAFEVPPPRAHAVLDQRNEAFAPYVLAVSVGTTVDFPNSDRTYHNVFSLSKARRFDLGRYPRGESRSVRFDDPGVVRVFCEIHSHMNAFILVFAHRYFATTEADGRYRIDDVRRGATRWQCGTTGQRERRAACGCPRGRRGGDRGGVRWRPWPPCAPGSSRRRRWWRSSRLLPPSALRPLVLRERGISVGFFKRRRAGRPVPPRPTGDGGGASPADGRPAQAQGGGGYRGRAYRRTPGTGLPRPRPLRRLRGVGPAEPSADLAGRALRAPTGVCRRRTLRSLPSRAGCWRR